MRSILADTAAMMAWMALSSVLLAAVHAQPVSNLMTVGHDNAQALFPAAPTAWTFCNGIDFDEATQCEPAASIGTLATHGTCLSKAEIASALANLGSVRDALYDRSDLRITIESQPGGSNTLSQQVYSFLAREVLGYGIKSVANQGYGDGLQRCVDQKYDLHAEIWKSDYEDAAWQEALFPPSGHGSCQLVGVNGIINYNAWHADTKTIEDAVANTVVGTQPMALDFWRAYTTEEAVQGLPAFDWAATQTLQRVDRPDSEWIPTATNNIHHWLNVTSGLVYFVPPLCQDVSVVCGIAYVIAPFFNPGLPQQMVRNLGWRIVLQLWASDALIFNPVTGFYPTALNRRAAGLQTLIMTDSLDYSVLGKGEWTRVSLPPVSVECLVGYDTVHWDGVGNHRCDFPQQTLFKLSTVNRDSDKADAFSLFNRLSFSHEIIADMLAKYAAGNKTMDIACEWIRENPSIWSTWITAITPRKHIVEVADSSRSIIYAFVAVFAAFSLVAHVFLFLNRAHPIVRRSSHTFCQLILLGADLFYACLCVGIQADSLTTCVVSQFLFSAAFTLFYISLLVKTYRIYWIFHSKALQTVKLPDGTMLLYLAAYGLIDLTLVILWAGIDAPTRTIETASADYALMTTCSSEKTAVFRTILYVLRGLALLSGGILAVRIRDVSDDYNESKFLAVISYNILLMCAIVLGLTLVGTRSPELRVGSWTIGVAIAVFISTLIFIVPKMLGSRFHRVPQNGVTPHLPLNPATKAGPTFNTHVGDTPLQVSQVPPMSTTGGAIVGGATPAGRPTRVNGTATLGVRKVSQADGAAYRQPPALQEEPVGNAAAAAAAAPVLVHGVPPTNDQPDGSPVAGAVAADSPPLPGTADAENEHGEGQ